MQRERVNLPNAALAQRSHRLWHLACGAIAAVLALWLLRALAAVLTPLALALVLSYALDPPVSWLQRRWLLPRWAGTLLLFLVALLLVGLGLLLLLPLVAREISLVADALPEHLLRLRDSLVPWVERTFHVVLPNTLGALVARAGSDLGALGGRLAGTAGGWLTTLAASTAAALGAVVSLLLVPVFTFYLLPSFPALVAELRALIPPRYREPADGLAREIDGVLAAWIRGQVGVMLCLTVVYTAGLALVGVSAPLAIGAVSGLLAFIPYVGLGVGLALALTVALLESQGLGQLLGVLVVFGSGQLLDGLFLTPRIVGKRVGLGPVGVLVALLVGGGLFGFFGVLVAVPVAAVTVVVAKRAVAGYRRSRFFDPSPPAAPTGAVEGA
jgi:predicted PurR-regulated permease PerM